MARSLPKLILITLIFSLTIFGTRSQTSTGSLSIEAGPRRSEKLSHLHFYLHGAFAGPNFTATQVASASTSSQSATAFGTVFVIDDVLKLGPDARSKLVGWAQCLTSSVSQAETVLSMAVNFVFTEGKFNGSTLSMLGRNSLALEVREMAITGGTGAFQLARGYVRTKTHSIDRTSGLLVSEYEVYVLHY
ncbi:pterocarpan synthase 1-like [Syzygium oleosum]|uniref:pterocarpan synthase 1-like n=1 Tax=Syzygium oleosum TaxID=219896 RepID=UPI0011D20FBF|nr:pterocarpan synthase 1-like [Syzygium oleosum]